MGSTRVITLREYRTLELEAHELDMADAMLIFRGFGDKIEVEEPSMRTGGRWRLRPSGWAGWIPLRPGLRLHLEPKFPAVNIFRMLEYAYSLTSFKTLAGIAEAESIEEIYRRLATVLARRVIDRGRRGLYRSYVPDEDRLPYVRGAVDVARSIRDPWNVSLHCAYQEHTADIRENQLLAWTLHTIIHQGIVPGDDLELVMAAWRSLRGTVTLRGFRPAECVGWLYHRLNEDYRPLHALCRFFLERAGPEHRLGAHDAIPFLVDMAKLYESYVAGYLARAIGPGFRLNEQQEADVADRKSVV